MSRFRYSRWDGTQVGFELGADEVLSEITDDLLYHGDLNAALRRMMQSGFRDRNGERLQGVREMLEKLPDAGDALAHAVPHALLEHAPEGGVHVAVVHEVVGGLAENVVRVEVEAGLGAVPPRVGETGHLNPFRLH